MRLVLPGNHLQFADWLRLVYGPGGGMGDPPARPVTREDDLRGITAEDVEVFHRVGSYWENSVWGSDAYRLLMEEGLLLGKHWAIEWTRDWRLAEAKRVPVSPEDMAAARGQLIRLEQRLTDDA